ncbi:cobalamin biosynthesis protein [Methylobacterium sp. W2]|uniref:cobalamin biosynthesis protein n=1 Tax=Methylobacterium sp. W2 TaxID=2598107 RepID=UPI001D0C7170|nr:cobalamin biosynthesis protein [Methylobacterium sp. W2]
MPAERIQLDSTEKKAFGTRILVAGIGFRHGAMPDEIVALIQRALAESGHKPDRLGAIATAEDRANEPSIVEAAAVFGLVPVGMALAEMIAVDARVPTRSGRIEASRRVGSVAEAAALAAAGEGGTLILARIASPAVTCALALPAYFATQAE